MVARFHPDPKQGEIRLPKYLAAAKGQACVCCGAEDGTIVAAHANGSIFGKAGHFKAHDCLVAWLCIRCHSWYDQGGDVILVTPRQDWDPIDKTLFIMTMVNRTIVEAFRQGLLRSG